MSIEPTDTAAVIRRYNAAFLQHDPSLLDGLIAEDCVIENTTPAPNGARLVGRAACLQNWQTIAANTAASFEIEDTTILGDRAIILWRYRWGEGDENALRGVNLMRVRDGLIVEALGYVKGA